MFDAGSSAGRGAPKTKMNNRPQKTASSLSDDDSELLSAYLDNELSAAERVNLERRLGADPGLQAELEDLRAVGVVLKSLDPLPPPRSFTLDPAQVARPRPFFPLTWFMQLGSGLAGLALVLLASIQLLAAGVGGAAPLPAAAPMAAATAAPAMGAPEAASEMRMQSAETTEAAGVSAFAEPTAAPAAGAAESAPAPAPTPAPSIAADQAPAGGAPAGGEMDGPTSNSPAPAQPPAGGASVDTMEGAGSAASGTAAKEEPQAPASAPAPRPAGLSAPILTMALGLALLAVAIGWNVVSRRRA
jgi:hypothetical protein